MSSRAVASGALLTLALAAPAQSGFPGENGLVAYDRVQEDGRRVLLAHPNGMIARTVPCTARDRRGRCHDSGPAWSRDGRRLALANKHGVVILTASGRVLRRIAVDRLGARRLLLGEEGPVWSPDGRKLAFYADDQLSSRVLRLGDTYVVGADGSGMRSLLREAVDPAWSVTNRIAFAGHALVTIHFGARRGRALYHGEAGTPAWSPFATRVAFSCAGFEAICTMRSSGRRARTVIRTPRSGDWLLAPVWSPDGGTLLFERRSRRTDLFAEELRSGDRMLFAPNARNADWQPLR